MSSHHQLSITNHHYIAIPIDQHHLLCSASWVLGGTAAASLVATALHGHVGGRTAMGFEPRWSKPPTIPKPWLTPKIWGGFPWGHYWMVIKTASRKRVALPWHVGLECHPQNVSILNSDSYSYGYHWYLLSVVIWSVICGICISLLRLIDAYRGT